MDELKYKELIAMLTVIYKKLDALDRKVNNKGFRSGSFQNYTNELRAEAAKIADQIS